MPRSANGSKYLIDCQRDDPKHEMRHDFRGPAQIDDPAAELILESPVELLDDGTNFVLLLALPGPLDGLFVIGPVYRMDDNFMLQLFGLLADCRGIIGRIHEVTSPLYAGSAGFHERDSDL